MGNSSVTVKAWMSFLCEGGKKAAAAFTKKLSWSYQLAQNKKKSNVKTEVGNELGRLS